MQLLAAIIQSPPKIARSENDSALVDATRFLAGANPPEFADRPPRLRLCFLTPNAQWHEKARSTKMPQQSPQEIDSKTTATLAHREGLNATPPPIFNNLKSTITLPRLHGPKPNVKY
jgi:hypothetical protein